MPMIEIVITRQGKTVIQTTGFQGPACLEATRFLEDALGKKLSGQQTLDFYLTQSTDEQIDESVDQ